MFFPIRLHLGCKAVARSFDGHAWEVIPPARVQPQCTPSGTCVVAVPEDFDAFRVDATQDAPLQPKKEASRLLRQATFGPSLQTIQDFVETYVAPGLTHLLWNSTPNAANEHVPNDFMFELTHEEYHSLRSQIVTLKQGQHSKYLPFAFTEQGIAMLSGILTSDRAISVNIEIMRAFIQLRSMVFGMQKLFKHHCFIQHP